MICAICKKECSNGKPLSFELRNKMVCTDCHSMISNLRNENFDSRVESWVKQISVSCTDSEIIKYLTPYFQKANFHNAYVEEQSKLNEKIQAELEEEKKHIAQYMQDQPLYALTGSRGRSIKVYRDRAVITTDPTLGAILTANATDGEKTIFYHDIVGIQFKRPGITLGYLQLETASGQMNNVSSNMFSENTFTFDNNTQLVDEIKDYITYRISRYKQL